MAINAQAPWHRDSFDRFVSEGLPALLKDRVPLDEYGTTQEADHVVLSIEVGGVRTEQTLPRPDADGVFDLRDSPAGDQGFRVVVPYPDTLAVDTATIRCVGEQLVDYLGARLGHAPEGVSWDRRLVETWLPLSEWVHAFLASEPTSQYLQNTNLADRATHLRRLTLIPTVAAGPAPLGDSDVRRSYVRGLTCPINTPEGPNAGWLLDVARGATIRDGRLVREAPAGDPVDDLGVTAAMVPFIEHDDGARIIMGMNMIRQWMAPRDPAGSAAVRSGLNFPPAFRDLLIPGDDAPRPEPALVRTGHEGDGPDAWGGYNLRTAFVMWDGDSFEDGLVVSASAAEKMGFPVPLEVGDKMSNRHGFKGVISRILPDDRMPALPDGRAIEIVVPPTGIVSRLNFGQIREAVMGRIAEAEGRPAVVAPFRAPPAETLKARLADCGFPEDGLEQLTLGGEPLDHRSTVGIVYWGRTNHTPSQKLSGGEDGGEWFGEKEMALLIERKALAVASDFAGRHGEGPTPFAALVEALSDRGIEADFDGSSVGFSVSEPEGVELPAEVKHPWVPGHVLERIPQTDATSAVAEAADELRKLKASGGPDVLVSAAAERLSGAVARYFDETPIAEALRVKTRVPASGLAVLAPGPELPIGSVGMPRAMAWSLFDRRVRERVGDASAEARDDRARAALEAIATDTWVVLYREPCFMWTAMTAFRPVLHDDPVVRINPRVCALLDADFDGDVVKVFVPSSDAGQAEAGRLLSVAGHLRNPVRGHDPLRGLTGRWHGMLWGLAELARSEAGRAKIESILGEGSAGRVGFKRELDGLVETLFPGTGATDDEIDKLFATLDALMHLAFDACRMSGVTVNPFLGEGLDLPEPPEEEDEAVWRIYRDEVLAVMDTARDPDDDDLGTLNVFRRTGSRGSDQQFFRYLGAHGPVDGDEGTVFVRHGYRDGLTADELFAEVRNAHRALAAANAELDRLTVPILAPNRRAYGVIARARQSERPGVVIGRAAARGERDPLRDVEARVFVGVAG